MELSFLSIKLYTLILSSVNSELLKEDNTYKVINITSVCTRFLLFTHYKVRWES